MGWSVLILQDGLLISTFCIARLLIKFTFLPCTGFIQKTILESVGCIWFNRNDLKDREVVAKKYNFSFPMHYLLYIVQFIKRTLSTGYEIMFNIQTAILS